LTCRPRFTEDKWADHPGLLPALMDRIRAQGKDGKVLDVLTKVQKHVLSSVDNSDNLYVIAPTGSGKTIAFMAPILQAMHDGKVDSAILLSPTNPLRKQHIAVTCRDPYRSSL
jgi:superfamily II DNA/RNA helicase